VQRVVEGVQLIAYSPHGVLMMWMCMLILLYIVLQGTMVGRTVATIVICASPPSSLLPPLRRLHQPRA
jgi:hypothetical protein